MNKGQLVAVFLAGTTAGIGGKAVVESVLSPATAEPIAPFVHAVDLRRSLASPAVRVNVYGTQPQADGGVTDLGQAKKCKADEKTKKLLDETMTALGHACAWE